MARMVTFLGYSVLPFPCGGAGRVRVVLDSRVEAVVALVGIKPATAWDDATLPSVPLAWEEGHEWRGVFFGVSRSPEAYVSIFICQDATWSAGPVINPVPLAWAYLDQDFPWIKRFLVARLQEIADQGMPLGADRRLKISSAYPRDPGTFPAISVQLDAVQPASESVGRLISGGQDRADRTRVHGTNYNMNISAIAWCSYPEDRDDIAEWLGSAMEVLTEILPEIGCLEPSASLDESEDFETLKIPLFLATGRINTSRWSALKAPAPCEYGLIFSY
jgi:hypothetical protein